MGKTRMAVVAAACGVLVEIGMPRLTRLGPRRQTCRTSFAEISRAWPSTSIVSEVLDARENRPAISSPVTVCT